MPASFLSRKLPGLLTAACALAATLPGIAAGRGRRPDPASRARRARRRRAGKAVLAGGCFWACRPCSSTSGRQLGRLRLCGRTGVHRQLRHGERRPQRSRRSRGDHLRPGPGQLRPAVADLFLGGARPDPAQPPGPRHRHPVPLSRVPRQRQPAPGGRGLYRAAEPRGRLRQADGHHDRAAQGLLSRRGLPPGLSGAPSVQHVHHGQRRAEGGEPGQGLPARYQDKPVLVYP